LTTQRPPYVVSPFSSRWCASPSAVGVGVRFEDALVAATRAPAERLGMRDRGVLVAGRRADMVALDDDLTVEAVIRGGVDAF
jgi:N-acetylglucosamine-6-phosphate deacetylase